MSNNIKGNRCYFISCNCYDLENECWVFVEDLDIRKPFERFIPEFIWKKIMGDIL